MKTKSLMVLALIALFIGMGTSAYAVTITPVISSDAAGTIPITTIAPGSRFFVTAQVDDATGIAGAAMTLVYDKTLFNVIGKDGVVADPATGAGEIDRGTYSGTNTDPANVVLESEAFGNMTDSSGTTTNTMTLRTGKIDATNGQVTFSGAYIDNTTGAAPATLTGKKNLFRVRFRVKTGVTTGTGTFTLQDSKPTAGGWDGATPVHALVKAVAKGATGFDTAATAFSNIAYTYGSAVTLPIQGVAGKVSSSTATGAPSAIDIQYLLYYTKFKKGLSGYEDYTSPFGNIDFNHDGKIDALDIQYLLYYTKFKKGLSGYDAYSSIE